MWDPYFIHTLHFHSSDFFGLLLLQAARDNRLEVVDQWIKILPKSELNKKDGFGYAPLHYAAKFNRFKVLKNIILAGAGMSIV